MINIFNTAKQSPLFGGIDQEDFEKLFSCIEARKRGFNKDEVILMSGDAVKSIGLILSGGVRIIKEDINGAEMIVAELRAPELFGEALACAGVDKSPITVRASSKAYVLFINYRKIISACSSACLFHTRLIENMLGIIAGKNLMLNQKIDILSKRTTREKLLAFFEYQRGGSYKFTVPYNREEMARYLCVDRSAMSNELCKMRDNGLISFKKNEFEIFYRSGN